MADRGGERTGDPPVVLEAAGVSREFTRGVGRGRLDGVVGRDSPTTVRALDDVSLTVREREIVGIAGPSGSGKSTLLHVLAALDVPSSGTVRFRDREVSSLSTRERTRFRLEHVGIVFQGFHLLDSLSARGNVALPLVELGVGKRERRRRATALLERVGLGDRVTHLPGELSGGERQRVAIARALVTDPTYLVADEPTGELDSETGRHVLREFERVAEDRSVVVASHDPAALSIADRVVDLVDGRIQSSEEPTVVEPSRLEPR